MKSMCQEARRNSPSVTDCSPASSCMRTTSRIASSSACARPASSSRPAACASRASSSSGGRSRLPTWSARNGGRVRSDMHSPPKEVCAYARHSPSGRGTDGADPIMCALSTTRRSCEHQPPESSRSSTAVADLVHDGDTVALEGFTHLIPVAAGHEIIRQRRPRPDARADDAGHRLRPADRRRLRAQARVLLGRQPGRRLAAPLPRRDPERLAGAAGDRGAQPRRARQPLRRRRLRAAVRGHARLPRHRPARAHGDDRADHLPVHRRAADRRARRSSSTWRSCTRSAPTARATCRCGG